MKSQKFQGGDKKAKIQGRPYEIIEIPRGGLVN